MPHHKRRRPKKSRAGCGLCKPHKKWPKGGSENPPRGASEDAGGKVVLARAAEILRLYQTGLDTCETAKQVGVNPSTVWRSLAKLGIGGRQYGWLRAFTTRQKAILYGTILGDGCLHRQRENWNANLHFGHGLQQDAYLRWKVSELRPLFRAAVRRTTSITWGQPHTSLRISSRRHPLLTDLHGIFYGSGRKAVTSTVLAHLDALGDQLPLALAVWYMDDGTLQRRNARLIIGSLDTAQYKAIARWFDGHGLRGYVYRRNLNCVSFTLNSISSTSFFEAISTHVHPSMRYKLPEVNRANV